VEAFVWIRKGSVEEKRREVKDRRNDENEIGTGD
jgi:hypothetical protein